jgi:thioesterase domain-containing protein/acyl carrier protein
MSETTPPRTNLERELVLIWEQVLQRAPIGVNEDFFDLGGTSVQAARIFSRIEEVFQKRLPLSVIISAPTVEQLAAFLLPGQPRDGQAYVVPIQPEGEKPVLFCVAGGIEWRIVSGYLGPDQPIFSVELDPSAVEQMKGPNALEKLARYMVSALCAKQPQGPYYVCGYCREGIFAYEVARQLTLYGHEVGLLALIDARNPSPQLRVRMMNGVRRNAIRLAFQVDQLYRLIRAGGMPQYVRAQRARLRRFLLRMSSSVAPGFQLRARQSGRLNSDEYLYVEANVFKPKPLACPTAIFRSAEWPIMSGGDPYIGWREFLTGRIETHEIPGDHEVIFREPNVQVFAEKLKACLENTKAKETPRLDIVLDVERRLYTGQTRA